MTGDPRTPGAPRVTPSARDADQPWLLRASTARLLMPAGLGLLAVLALLDLVIEGHPHFGIDGTFGFHAWYGLVSGIGVVVVARVLGIFLKRTDRYYDVD